MHTYSYDISKVSDSTLKKLVGTPNSDTYFKVFQNQSGVLQAGVYFISGLLRLVLASCLYQLDILNSESDKLISSTGKFVAYKIFEL